MNNIILSNIAYPISTDKRLSSDVEAVLQWLRARGNRSQHTFDAYKREAEKFLTWVFNQKKELKNLTVTDITQYLFCLESRGTVKPSTINYSRKVLSQMFQYLSDMGYVEKNVVSLTPAPPIHEEEEPVKFLDLDAWVWLWKWLTSRPAANESQVAVLNRDRWLFALIYHTGLRREEVAKGSMADFTYRQGRWILRVSGKRKKIRQVSVNSILFQELKRYRQSLGLNEIPSIDENYGLVVPLKGDQYRRLTPRAIGLMIYECKNKAVIDCEDDHIRIQIIDMSTHWLRHTNTTHRYMAGASTETIQDEQGHADPKTTRIYLKTLPGKRKEDAEKLATLHSNAIDSSS